jgi:pimeloyl-ACP methyl ester carboxylesterase
MDGLRTADARRLAYRRFGSGPTLVCHPGGPGFSSLYLGELGGLGEHLELVLLDPRGTGASDPPADRRAFAIDDYVSDLEEVRAHLGGEPMRLFGHSHGGVVAIAYAARYPERVERLILASMGPRFSPEQLAATEEAIAGRSGEPWYSDARAAFETEISGEFDGDEELMELCVRMMPFYFARYGDAERAWVQSLAGDRLNADATRLWENEIFERFDLRPELARITAPTLVITGERDFITGPACAAELEQGLPQSETVILPGVGHLIFVEAPGAFREAVLRFLGVGVAA